MTRHPYHLGFVAVALASTVALGCNTTEPEPAAPTTMESARPMDDDQLATHVQSRFYADSAIRDGDIDVSASGGVVTLSGHVDSEEAKQRAVSVAREIEGVSNVNDQLRVQAPGSDATAAANRRGEQAEERTPGWITTKIQSQYFVNPEIKPWNIDVTTSQDGVVTLRGEVDESNDRQEAERIAQATDGVSRVINRLRVRGETPMADADKPAAERTDADRADADAPDAWVTAKIQAKYFVDPDVKGLAINVDTNDGIVTLRGEVESEAERRQAIALARNTEGVKSVTDQLRLERETEAAEPAADKTKATAERAGDKTAAAAKETTNTVDDVWITTKIQSKFFLDADVKGRDINVDTARGVVTLKGTVESEAEKLAAASIAQETEGVSRVNNQLKVETTVKQ